MIFSIILAQAQGASGEPSNLDSLVKVLGPVIIAGIVSLITIILTQYFQRRGKKDEAQSGKYQSDMDAMAKQKEFIIKENSDLWFTLKAELDALREERDKMEAIIDNLRKRLTKIETELTAWELGLKVPKGFSLVKTENGKSDA